MSWFIGCINKRFFLHGKWLERSGSGPKFSLILGIVLVHSGQWASWQSWCVYIRRTAPLDCINSFHHRMHSAFFAKVCMVIPFNSIRFWTGVAANQLDVFLLALLNGHLENLKRSLLLIFTTEIGHRLKISSMKLPFLSRSTSRFQKGLAEGCLCSTELRDKTPQNWGRISYLSSFMINFCLTSLADIYMECNIDHILVTTLKTGP